MSDLHREHCRRQHRVLGQFLAIEAWLRGVDCIVIGRDDLEQYLGLIRFKSTRVYWLQLDLKPWFPYQKDYYSSTSPSSLNSLFLSRVPIERHLPDGTMLTESRVAQMTGDAPLTQMFSSARRLPSEGEIVAYLAQLSAGLVLPKRRKRAKRRAR